MVKGRAFLWFVSFVPVELAGGTLTCDKETALAVEVKQCLPPLALPVLDHVGLIQNQVLPLLAPEHLGILHRRNPTADTTCV